MSGMLVNVWRHWWHSSPQIWDVGHFYNLLLKCSTCVCMNLWMALRARNTSPSGHATLNPRVRATELGQGRDLRASLRATEPRARGKTHVRQRKKCRWAKKNYRYMFKCLYITRHINKTCVCALGSVLGAQALPKDSSLWKIVMNEWMCALSRQISHGGKIESELYARDPRRAPCLVA